MCHGDGYAEDVKVKRRLAAPFVVTVSTLGFSAGCDSSTTGGAGGAGGAADDGCIYHPAKDCSDPSAGAPCSDDSGYCTLQIECGHFPELDDRTMICEGGTWAPSPTLDFDPGCDSGNSGTATGSSNPPAPCPCEEPMEGSSCDKAFGQESPCTYQQCEQLVCDSSKEWVKEETCQ